MPFLVRNAKLTGSGPTVLRQSVLLNVPVFELFWKVSMFSAEHHCVALQPMPAGHGDPARRIELHLHEALTGAEAEVPRAVRSGLAYRLRVAVRLARHGRVTVELLPERVRRALVVAQLHAEPEGDSLLEVPVAAAAVLLRSRRRVLRQAEAGRSRRCRARLVRKELHLRFVVTDVGRQPNTAADQLLVARDTRPSSASDPHR